MATTKEGRGATAAELATRQRDISVSEFFAKNRHLLGFDNPTKALLTTIKEAVDNALDACEEAGVLPDVLVRVDKLDGHDDRYSVTVTDNGPGILKTQVPKIFGKLLYGSKFHTLKQSRGQQGIGISAAGMYGQLTTGSAVCIVSRIHPRKPAHLYKLHIDTVKNRPEIVTEQEDADFALERGTEVKITLQARYVKGRRSVDDYLRATSLANPHARLRYMPPDRAGDLEVVEFPRTAQTLPPAPREIRPHPHGVELGVLIEMLRSSRRKGLGEFLQKEFSRVGPTVARTICQQAGFTERTRLGSVDGKGADLLHKVIARTALMAPPTNCLSPIGESLILASIEEGIEAEFHTSITRRPSVYRGNPFLVEVGLTYGSRRDPAPSAGNGDEDEAGQGQALLEPGQDNGTEQPISLMRFANRVPLLYQQSACAINKAVVDTPWRNYKIKQSRGALPVGPITLLVNIASVWVPFTSESKEAIAHYPEIVKELRLGIQECGRRLGRHLKRKRREESEAKKRSYIEKYIPHIGIALQTILALTDESRERVEQDLKGVLQRSRNTV